MRKCQDATPVYVNECGSNGSHRKFVSRFRDKRKNKNKTTHAPRSYLRAGSNGSCGPTSGPSSSAGNSDACTACCVSCSRSRSAERDRALRPVAPLFSTQSSSAVRERCLRLRSLSLSSSRSRSRCLRRARRRSRSRSASESSDSDVYLLRRRDFDDFCDRRALSSRSLMVVVSAFFCGHAGHVPPQIRST